MSATQGNGRNRDGGGRPGNGGARGSPPAEESVMEFPLDFPIKVIGRDSPTFQETVLTILDTHFAEVPRDRVDTRPSREGRYIAITATVRAESRAQLDAAYRALSASVEVLWAL